MAEGLLRAKAGERFEVMSAGPEPATRVNPHAIEAMREIGIDISGARPKDAATFVGTAPVHHLIIVCDDAAGRCPTGWPGVITRTHWSIEDPAAFQGDPDAALAKFREIRDDLSRRLDHWVTEQKTAAR